MISHDPPNHSPHIPAGQNITTRSVDRSLERVAKSFNNSMVLVNAILEQNSNLRLPNELKKHIIGVNLEALKQINKLQDVYLDQAQVIGTRKEVSKSKNQSGKNVSKTAYVEKETLSSKDIKDLKKLIDKAEYDCAEIIRNMQVNIVAKLGASEEPNHIIRHKLEEQIKILCQGGWRAFKLRIFSDTTNSKIAFSKAQKKLEENAYQHLESKIQHGSNASLYSSLTKSEKDNLLSFSGERRQKDLRGRMGVIRTLGFYSISTVFDTKQIINQIKSVAHQNISSRTRRIIRNDVYKDSAVNLGGRVESVLTPLNEFFDEKNKISNFFGKLFGIAGVSSGNKIRRHLINPYLSELKIGGEDKPICRLFRHSALADYNEPDLKTRRINAKKMTEELLIAATLQQLAEQGKSLDQIDHSGEMLNVNFVSVSLITPDDFVKGSLSEKRMLKEQVEALMSFNGKQKFNINGKSVNVNMNIIPFNFGVNAPATKLNLGLINQRTLNKQGIKRLEVRVDTALQQGNFDEFTKAKINLLMNDIKLLGRSPSAYLSTGNQYEIGAKIINLTNLLNDQCACNCKSGKDRTGQMDASAKTIGLMLNSMKTEKDYPSAIKFTKDKKLQKRYNELYIPMLSQGGGLDLTEVNTDARGLKIQSEGRVFGMDKKAYEDLKGLSPTT